MEQLSNTGLTTTSTCCWERFRATQASVSAADMNSFVSLLSVFSLLLFLTLLFLLHNQKKCQEPPLTPNHSWVTAPIYLIPPCHSTQIMFCAILVIYRNSETVGSSYNTSNCWDSVNSLWFLKKFAGVLSGLVLNVLYYQDSEWLRGETKVQPLLRGSIYPIRHFIKFVRCILVYTQELWQLKMADVSV